MKNITYVKHANLYLVRVRGMKWCFKALPHAQQAVHYGLFDNPTVAYAELKRGLHYA